MNGRLFSVLCIMTRGCQLELDIVGLVGVPVTLFPIPVDKFPTREPVRIWSNEGLVKHSLKWVESFSMAFIVVQWLLAEDLLLEINSNTTKQVGWAVLILGSGKRRN